MKITDEMVEAGCRAMHEQQGTEDADAPLHSPYQKSWEEPDRVRWMQWDETVRDVFQAMVTAAPASAEPVKVMPLAWEETVEETGRYASAKTRVGGYDAFEFTLTTPSKTKIVTGWTGHWKNGEQHTASFDEAKAAAQADYEQRIRSALEAKP